MTDDIRAETGVEGPESVAPKPVSDADQPTFPEWDPEQFGERAGQEPGDLIPSLSPKQIIGGFVALAAAVVILRRLGRSRPGPKG